MVLSKKNGPHTGNLHQHRLQWRSTDNAVPLTCSNHVEELECNSSPVSNEDLPQCYTCPCCSSDIARDSFHTHVSSCFLKSSTSKVESPDVIESIESIRTQVNKIDLRERINMMQSLHRLATATKPRNKRRNSSRHQNTNPELQVNITNYDNQMLAMLFSEACEAPPSLATSDGSPCSLESSPLISPSPYIENESLDEGLGGFDGFTDEGLGAFDFDSIVFACDTWDKEGNFDQSIYCESTTPTISHADPGSLGPRKRSSDLHRDLDQFMMLWLGETSGKGVRN